VWNVSSKVTRTESEYLPMMKETLLLILVRIALIWSRTYEGNIWDFNGKTAAEQIIYGSASEGMFGSNIAAWGDRIVIGEISGNDNKGQVSVYTHLDENGEDVGGWYLESTLTDYYGSDGDLFGCAVAIYATTVIVGAKHKDWYGYEDSGSAYIYEIHLNQDYQYQWTFVTQLTRDEVESQDYFGNAVGIYGNTSVVGCYGCDPSGTMSGAVYVYAKYFFISDDGTETYQWAYHHTMTAPSGSRYDWFGVSLSIYNDVIAVGATGLDDPMSLEGNTGGAFVFDVVPDDTYADGVGWKVFAELSPGDGATGDGFGTSISVYDGVVVIGSPYAFSGAYHSGAVYVYHKDSSDNWYFEYKLTPQHPTSQLHYGYSVGVYKDILLVGSLNETGLNSVSLYGKEYDTTFHSNINWDLIYELQPIQEIAGDKYGSSIAIFESVIVVGAPMASSPWQDTEQNENENNNRLYNNGAIHVYWATDRISIEYISKKIKAFHNDEESSTHLSSPGIVVSILCGLLIGGYIYYAGASYVVKLEDEEKSHLLTQNKDSKQYQQTFGDSSHGSSDENKIDISMRDISNENSGDLNENTPNQKNPTPSLSASERHSNELLRASLARLSTRSSHGISSIPLPAEQNQPPSLPSRPLQR
jgi:hypothetical protein